MRPQNLLLPAIVTLSLSAAAQQRANLLFIFADDLTYDCLGVLGKDNLSTPNLDYLVERGVLFTRAYNQGAWSGAVSAASRAMMITGEYLWNAAQYCDYTRDLRKSIAWPSSAEPLPEHTAVEVVNTWPSYMKSEGYTTYMTGKWHAPIDVEQCFDYIGTVRGGMPMQSQDCYDREFIEGKPDKWQPYDTSYGGYWDGGEHWSEVVRDEALTFFSQLQTQREGESPFFMYVAFNAPHDPRQAPKEYIDMYPISEIETPENFLPYYPYNNDINCAFASVRDERLAVYPRTPYSVKVNRQEYYALITHMDHQIGIILDALRRSGELDNTYIIFTADHGISLGDHGFIGKQNMYDRSMRVPLILVGPDIPQGQRVDDLVYLQDAMATGLDIAGSEALSQVQFQSLLPLARGEAVHGREAVYGAYKGAQRMIRSDRYKMLIYPMIDMVRLYDLEEDPHEMVDLADQESYLPIMKQLFAQFKELQAEVSDPLDVTQYFNRFIENKFNK